MPDTQTDHSNARPKTDIRKPVTVPLFHNLHLFHRVRKTNGRHFRSTPVP